MDWYGKAEFQYDLWVVAILPFMLCHATPRQDEAKRRNIGEHHVAKTFFGLVTTSLISKLIPYFLGEDYLVQHL